MQLKTTTTPKFILKGALLVLVIITFGLGSVQAQKAISIEYTEEGKLNWAVIKGNSNSSYVVQAFKWNKWVSVSDTIKGRGPQKYSAKMSPCFKYRILNISNNYNSRSTSNRVPKKCNDCSFSPIKVRDTLTFNQETHYEIYDAYGQVVSEGTTTVVNVSHLKKGIYYINYCNETGEFIKK